MAHCIALTKGRELDCSRISGGVRYLYFGVYDDFTTPIETAGIIQASGTVTTIATTAASVIYRYAMPLGASSVSETITGSTENGTIFYTPTVNVMLNKLTAADQNEIKLFQTEPLNSTFTAQYQENEINRLKSALNLN